MRGFVQRSLRTLERKKAKPFSGDAFMYNIVTLIICLGLIVGTGVFMVTRYVAGNIKAKSIQHSITDKDSFDNIYFSDRIFEGVSISGYKVGGMTMNEAKNYLASYVNTLVKSPAVTLTYQGKTWTLDSAQFVVKPDLDSAVKEAWEIGRTGTAEEREKTYDTLEKDGINLSANAINNTDYITQVLEGIKKEIDVEKKNATVSFSYNNGPVYKYTDEVTGIYLNVADSTKKLCTAIANGAASGSVTYELVPEIQQPDIKRSNLELPYQKIASFQTSIAATKTGRRQNIEIALAAFNNYVWMPEETLSFNQLLGERTADKGFANGVYINSQQLYDETVGGGICQVSTTLYNAALLCGANQSGTGSPIELVERNPHSWPSSYIAKGLDASVNWPSADLRMRNASSAPYFIRTYMGTTSVNVEIYGIPLPDNATISMATETLETTDAGADEYINDTTHKYNLAPGEKKLVAEARTGYKIVTYQIWKIPGQEPIKTILNYTVYKAVPAKYYVGV